MLKNRRREAAISFDGQKSALPVEAYGFKSAQNVNGFVLKDDRLRKVNGGDTYAGVAPDQSGGITSLHRFKNLWVAQRGGTTVAENAEEAATFTNIFTDLSDGKFYSSQWRDRLFLVNQVEAKFLLNRANNELDDGYKTGDIGVDPPDFPGIYPVGADVVTSGTPGGIGFVDTAPFLVYVTNTGSGHMPEDSYYYIMTFFDSETNSESPGWGSLVTTDGISELTISSGLGPKMYNVILGIGTANSKINFEYASLAAYLQAQKAKYPRITHFRFYRWDGSIGDGLPALSDFKAVPQTAPFSSSDTFNVIGIDSFLSDGLNFIDDTVTADLPEISPPENNYLFNTPDRSETLYYSLFYGAGRRYNGVDQSIVFVPQPIEGPYNFNSDGYKTFRKTSIFRDQLFGFGSTSIGVPITPYNVFTFGGEYPLTGTQFNEDSILHGSEVYQPDYFPYLWEVGRGDGQTAIGTAVLGDTALLLFKEKSTYYLSGSSPSDFVVRILDTNKGCVNESTIQETPNGVICLDRTGFVLFNKIGQGERISTDIQDVIDSILFTHSSTFYSFYDPKEQRYSCAVVVPGGETPNLTLTLDLLTMQWTTDSNIIGLSRMADTDSNGEYVEIVGGKESGRLINMANEEVPTFLANPIYATWTSGALSFGDDQHKKKMRWVYLKVQAHGDWSITLQVIPDFDEAKVYSIGVNYSSVQNTWYTSDASTDGTLIWDEGTWATDDPTRAQIKVPIVCKGRLFQVRIINKDATAGRWGFSLEGISAEAVMLEK